jgi:hypothetical protein
MAMYLKRYDDVDISKSGVWRILKCLDMNRLPVFPRYDRQIPNHNHWRTHRAHRSVPPLSLTVILSGDMITLIRARGEGNFHPTDSASPYERKPCRSRDHAEVVVVHDVGQFDDNGVGGHRRRLNSQRSPEPPAPRRTTHHRPPHRPATRPRPPTHRRLKLKTNLKTSATKVRYVDSETAL